MEIKLDLVNEHNFDRLLDRLGEPAEIREQTNYFLDSDNWDLSQSGWALRLRSYGETVVMTAKGVAAENIDGLTVRPEIEETISVDELKRFLSAGTLLRNLPPKINAIFENIEPDLRLTKKLSFTTIRHIIEHRDGNIGFRFELDKTIYPDGGVDYELEVEIANRAMFPPVEEIIRRLLDELAIPWKLQKESKFGRALKKNRDRYRL